MELVDARELIHPLITIHSTLANLQLHAGYMTRGSSKHDGFKRKEETGKEKGLPGTENMPAAF